MSFLSNFFEKSTSTDEMIKKTFTFLSPQIELLKEYNDAYEFRMDQRSVYYILCVAEEIAEREIDSNEFRELLLNLFGKTKSTILFNSFSIAQRGENTHIDFKNVMMPIAVKNVKNEITNSSDFLITNAHYVQEMADRAYEGNPRLFDIKEVLPHMK